MRQRPETHLLLLAQAAPTPPHIRLGEHVVLSVQSVVVRHRPPKLFSKHLPPLHLPERHCEFAVQVVPGQDAKQTPGAAGVPLQLPLWHWLLLVQEPAPP